MNLGLQRATPNHYKLGMDSILHLLVSGLSLRYKIEGKQLFPSTLRGGFSCLPTPWAVFVGFCLSSKCEVDFGFQIGDRPGASGDRLKEGAVGLVSCLV